MGHATAGRRDRIKVVTRQLRILSPQPALAGGTNTTTPGTVVSECGAAVARYLNGSDVELHMSRTKVLS